MKWILRSLAWMFLLTLCLTAAAGCNSADPIDPATTVAANPSATAEPAPAFDGLTIDSTYRIVISSNASEIIRKTADMVAAAIREKAGLELPIVTDAEAATEHELVLGPTNRTFYTADLGWNVFRDGQSLYIHSNDHTTLYFAAEAVLETWLTPDFGLTAEGGLILPKDRVAELNGLTTRRNRSIKVLSQNMRYADDANGNTVQARAQRFLQMLEEYQPDLIGGQEYTYNWNIWLTKHTKKAGGEGTLDGYGMINISRDGSDGRGDESNPIFYRLERFELLETETFWLSDTPERVSKVEKSDNYRICTWALLKDKLTGETILFANTHLDHTTDTVRGEQAEILMNYLARRVGQYTTYLTGDFNCVPESIPYGTVAATLSDSHKTAWIDHSTVSNTYHDYTDEGYSEIDFIFHNDKTTPVSYEIISKKYDGFVADHYGVIAEFVND